MKRLVILVLLLATGLVKLHGQPSPPVPGVPTQPTCETPTGSVVLSGLPEPGSWTINPGSISGTGPTATILGLDPGTYNFTVTNEALQTSDPSVNVVINAVPIPPEAATITITQPTCAVTTGTIVILTPVGAYEYNIDGGIWQASTTFTGVTSGLHTLLVRSATDNTCVSPPASATIDEPPPDPATATFDITQPTCAEPTGTIIITSPTGSFEYNLDGGTWQAGVTFTGVPAGLHTILVRSTTDNACVSDPVSANVESPPLIPDAPVAGTITQPTCTVSTGGVVIKRVASHRYVDFDKKSRRYYFNRNRDHHYGNRTCCRNIHIYSRRHFGMYLRVVRECCYQSATSNTNGTNSRNNNSAYLHCGDRQRGIRRIACNRDMDINQESRW